MAKELTKNFTPATLSKEIMNHSWVLLEETEPVALWHQANGWGDIIIHSGKHLGKYQRTMAVTFEGLRAGLYGESSEWASLGNHCVRKIISDIQFRKNLIHNIHRYSDKLFAWNTQSLRIYQSMDKSQLLSLFVEGLRVSGKLYSCGILPVYADLAQGGLTKTLLGILQNKGLSPKEANRLFPLLTTPKKESYFKKEEKALWKIRVSLSARPASFTKLPAATQKLLRLHTKKWEYLGYSFLGAPLELDYFFNRLQELFDESAPKASITEKFSSVTLSIGERNLFSAVAELTWLKDYRKAALMQYYYVTDKICHALAQTTGILYEDIIMMQESEIISAVRKGSLPKEMKERKKQCVIYISKGKMPANILIGNTARAVISCLKNNRREDIESTEVRGQVAYPGIVEGKVCLLSSAKENAKVQEGDIIVATMTFPELLPAMKKAAAFVTDTGGITCHAAIVAREMKKPCVVGTRIATKIFKDGDMVEVNAYHGEVRKI